MKALIRLSSNVLLGENLEDEQVEELFADCMDPEDDDGMIPYSRKFTSRERELLHNFV